jgi:hypothetical protein
MHDARNGIHAGLTAIMGWLALRLGISGDVFGSSSSFGYMAKFAPEHAWAVLFLGVANIGVIGLITRKSVVRLTSVLVVATAHGVLAGCLLMSDASVWSGTYAIIAVMGYYLAYRWARAGV